jgi:type VI secretion system protein ImpH
MGQPGQMAKGSLNSHARFTHAGHLTRHGRDPEGLEKILRDYFKVPVKLVMNVPQWMPLTTREQARLGAGHRQPRMGESAFVGIAVRDVQHKFRIEIGPLSADEYNRFLPGEAWVTELRDWVRQYVGLEYEWETRLILRSDAVQGATLSAGEFLGYNTWLGLQPQPVPRGDLVYRAER